LNRVLGGKVPEQRAACLTTALEEGGVGLRERIELGLGRLAVDRHRDLGRCLRIAPYRAALADAAGVEGDHFVSLLELGDMLRRAHRAELLRDTRAATA